MSDVRAPSPFTSESLGPLWLTFVAAAAGVFCGLIAKVVIAILLISLAVSKAALVAMYFMHLRFERLTLGLIAVTPLVLGTLLVFILVPDHSAVSHRTSDAAKTAPAAGHK